MVDGVQGALVETNERQSDDFCNVVYLGANYWPELLAELKLLLSQLEIDTELFPCSMPTMENFHYRIGLVYSSCDELKRKIRLALHLLEKEAG